MTMFQRVLPVALSLLAIPAAATAAPDEAKTLIEKHVTAAGGVEAFAALVGVHRCGTIEFFSKDGGPDGQFRYETALHVPDLLVERLGRPGQMLVHRGYDQSKPWDGVGAASNQSEAQSRAMMEDTIQGANRDGIGLLNVADRAEIVPRPAGVPATETCIRVPSIPEIPMHCYSAETGMLSYQVRGDSQRHFADWRKVGDVMLPFALTQKEAGQVVYEIRLEAAEANPDNIKGIADEMRQAVSPAERLTCSPVQP